MCSALQAHWEQQNTRHVSSLHHGLSSSQVCVDYQKKKKKKKLWELSQIYQNLETLKAKLPAWLHNTWGTDRLSIYHI